jgi:hypothetical protein
VSDSTSERGFGVGWIGRLSSKKAFAHAAVVLVTMALFVVIDRAIGKYEGGGPYRAEIPRPIRAVQRASGARHLVLGCSTSNWFAVTLAKAWRVEKSAVVDGHMSDCLQTCTLAEARHLQALGRHFDTVTFGVNSFEYCESYRERRSMQEVELMPLANSLELARVYLQSEDPLRYVGGWLMNQVSLVYGNTMWLQRHTRKALFGNESPNGGWFRRELPKPRRRESFVCDYTAADRDFGLAATRGALQALEALADRVLLVVLPDRGLSTDTPVARAARELFVREHRELAADFERVELVDLAVPELARREFFRDGAHLNAKGIRAADKLLSARVRALPAAAGAGASRADRDTGASIETNANAEKNVEAKLDPELDPAATEPLDQELAEPPEAERE